MPQCSVVFQPKKMFFFFFTSVCCRVLFPFRCLLHAISQLPTVWTWSLCSRGCFYSGSSSSAREVILFNRTDMDISFYADKLLGQKLVSNAQYVVLEIDASTCGAVLISKSSLLVKGSSLISVFVLSFWSYYFQAVIFFVRIFWVRDCLF